MQAQNRPPVGDTHKIKAYLIKQASLRCEGCGYQFKGHPQRLARENGQVELDHKVPLQRGGRNEWTNYQVLCLPCHDGKTNDHGRCGPVMNMTDREWRQAGRPQDWQRKKSIMRSRSAR